MTAKRHLVVIAAAALAAGATGSALGAGYVKGMAANADYLYWTRTDSSSANPNLARSDRAGTAPNTSFASLGGMNDGAQTGLGISAAIGASAGRVINSLAVSTGADPAPAPNPSLAPSPAPSPGPTPTTGTTATTTAAGAGRATLQAMWGSRARLPEVRQGVHSAVLPWNTAA